MTTAAPVAAYTAEFVERGYNNRAAVPDHPAWLERFAARSQEVIATLAPRRDMRYGRGPQETLDLYLPSGTPRGVLVFVHGGYWRSLDKRDHAFVAPPFVTQGLAVAVVNYDLCPAVSIARIVEQVNRAVARLAGDGARLGLPRVPLVVAGHSAGGHLAAMALATPAAGFGMSEHPVHAAVSLSGVHDLAPMLHFSYRADFGLDAAGADALSPVRCAPQSAAPLVLAVGADETSEFLRQADLMWDAWPANRPAGMAGPLRIAGRHHFSAVMDFAAPDAALTRATLALF